MTPILSWINSNLLGLLAIILAPTLAWFFNRRKTKAETNKIEADIQATYLEGITESSSTAVKTWQELTDEMRNNYNDCMRNQKILLQNYEDVRDKLAISNEYILKLERYSDALRSVLLDLLDSLEPTNPELVKINREKLTGIIEPSK